MKWFKKKRIIVPFDFSDDSMRAIRVGTALAERKENVHVVHVLPHLPLAGTEYGWEDFKERERQADSKRAIEEKLELADIRDVKVDVLVGDPSMSIVDLANEIETDLIVIPSRGYTGLADLLLGSVARGVVRHARCPVLVLKQ